MEQKIATALWFNTEAEEAADFYLSVFKEGKKGAVMRFGDAGPGPKGSVLSVTFQLHGHEFIALNGGPQFKFNPAISMFVKCQTQQEVDELWEALSEGGRKDRCGWLQDKYGLSWQIVPVALGQMLQNGDAHKTQKAMQAMLQMDKLDIDVLQQAYNS